LRYRPRHMARGTRDEIAPGEIANRIQRREFLRRESRERRERSRRLEVFLSSAATLREVKARKTPSASSDVGGVFRYGVACGPTRSRAMRSRGSDRQIMQELTRPLRDLLSGKGVSCHARMDGNPDQCDRLCRLHRRRDLSQVARRKISGPLSAGASGVGSPCAVSSPCAVHPQCGPVCRP
jgi:hypothetical protein